MGRGAYEHNYTQLNLPALAAAAADPAPVAISLPAELAGTGPLSADVYCAENLALLEHCADGWAGRFQLLYLDPPFGSGKVYAARVDGDHGQQSQAVAAYRDDQDFDDYLLWLFRRLAFARDLLADTGTLYVHLDWHAVHYVKVELDRLFGRQRFLNEIIWCYHGPSPIRSAFKRKHDTILVYTRSADYYFDADAVRVPYDESTVKTFASSSRAGFGKVPDLARGKVPEDWWYFPVVARVHSERVGYETQKPVALLERIVKASSRPNDVVGDFFAGAGTAGVAAVRLGRHAVLADRNPVAVEKTVLRLARLSPTPTVRLWRYFTDHTGRPQDEPGS
jgi:site-specific DNA-methyltransferase (adenine-specific)